jgi:hypothetical protein
MMEFRPIWNYTTRYQSTRALKKLSGAILKGMAAATYERRRSPIPAGIQDDTPEESAEKAVENH